MNNHIVNTCLRSLFHSEFEVDRVTLHIFFNRHKVIEEITVVEIQVSYGIIIGRSSLFKELLVIYISRLNFKDSVKEVGVVNSVTYPRYIVDIIFLTFLNVDVHIHALFIVRHNAVAYNLGIAVTEFIVLFNNSFQVILIIILDKFFLSEKIHDITVFVCLLDGSLNLFICKHFVTINIYFVNLHLVVFINIDIHNHFVGFRKILMERNHNVGIAESLFLEIVFDDEISSVDYVLCNLVADKELQFFLKVFSLTFLHTVVVNS